MSYQLMFAHRAKSQVSAAILKQPSVIRSFTQSTSKRNNHHDDHGHGHEEQIDDNLLDNHNYIAIGAGLFLSSATLIFDNNYKKTHGESFFGRFIKPTSAETIDKENVSYVEETINNDIKLHEVFFAQKSPDPFGKADFSTSISVIPRGSPFNSSPGSTTVDIDSIKVRRSNKSVFE